MGNSPGRRLGLMMGCLAGLLLTVVAINWIVNPYGVWRTTVVDRVYRLTGAAADDGGERLSTAYRIRAERPTTLLVGSSRVRKGMLVEPSEHDTFFNASLSGASLDELVALLRLATANPRLRRVVWGVEFYAFDERFVGFDPETRRRLDGDESHVRALQIMETLLSMRALRDSSRVLTRAARGQKPDLVSLLVPWPEHLIKERLETMTGRGLARADDASIKLQLQNWIVSYVDYRLSRPQLALFRQAVEDLGRRGLDVILFVPPLSRCELDAIDQAGVWDTFQSWKRALLVAGPYWDFSGYGKLDRAPELFLDVPHFKSAVGQVILREVLGAACNDCGERARLVQGAGVWVDTATVDAYLARQENARAASRHQEDPCAKAVEAMLHDRTNSTLQRR